MVLDNNHKPFRLEKHIMELQSVKQQQGPCSIIGWTCQFLSRQLSCREPLCNNYDKENDKIAGKMVQLGSSCIH